MIGPISATGTWPSDNDDGMLTTSSTYSDCTNNCSINGTDPDVEPLLVPEPKEDDWPKTNFWLTWPSMDDGHLPKPVPGGARDKAEVAGPSEEMNTRAHPVRAPDP